MRRQQTAFPYREYMLTIKYVLFSIYLPKYLCSKLNLNLPSEILLLACHKESYLISVEFSNFQKYAIFIHFQAAVSTLLATSVLCIEKKSK